MFPFVGRWCFNPLTHYSVNWPHSIGVFLPLLHIFQVVKALNSVHGILCIFFLLADGCHHIPMVEGKVYFGCQHYFVLRSHVHGCSVVNHDWAEWGGDIVPFHIFQIFLVELRLWELNGCGNWFLKPVFEIKHRLIVSVFEFFQPLLVHLSLQFFLYIPPLPLKSLQGYCRGEKVVFRCLCLFKLINKLWNLSFERNLSIVVNVLFLPHSLDFFCGGNIINSCHF